MPVGAAIGGALVGGVTSIIGGNKAAKAQKNASNAEIEANREIYDQQRADQAPYRDAGYASLADLRAGLGQGGEFSQAGDFSMADYEADPGYQFRREQGERAIQRGASARGLNLSGATLKALNRFNSGNASQEYGAAYDRFNQQRTNRFNQRSTLAGLGQSATSQTNANASNYGNNLSNSLQSIGNANAANAANTYGAIGGAVNSGVSNYLTLSMLGKK